MAAGVGAGGGSGGEVTDYRQKGHRRGGGDFVAGYYNKAVVFVERLAFDSLCVCIALAALCYSLLAQSLPG